MAKTVDDYIAGQPVPAQRMLKDLRVVIRAVAPEAREQLSYGIPFYQYKYPGFRGRLAYFAAYEKHVRYYALPHEIPVGLERKISSYRTGKSTLQFALGTRIPVAVIRELAKLRKAQIDGGR